MRRTVGFVEAHGDDLGAAAVAFDVGLEDGVEDVVGGQGVGVELVGAELGAGGFVEHGLGDEGGVRRRRCASGRWRR